MVGGDFKKLNTKEIVIKNPKMNVFKIIAEIVRGCDYKLEKVSTKEIIRELIKALIKMEGIKDIDRPIIFEGDAEPHAYDSDYVIIKLEPDKHEPFIIVTVKWEEGIDPEDDKEPETITKKFKFWKSSLLE